MFGNNWYVTDLWTDFAFKFIDQALTARSRSFSIWRTMRLIFPLMAPAERSRNDRGKYK